MLLLVAFSVICLNNIILAEVTFSCNEPSILDNIRKTITVDFLITTSQKSYTEYFVKNTTADIKDYEDFAKNNKTYILVHGYTRSYEDSWIPWLKSRLLEMGSTNVITLNYDVYPLSYKNYAFSTPYIAFRTVEFLKEIAKALEKPVNKLGHIHIIGHSLGSHIAGQIAAQLKAEQNFVVDRVTGLDPAEPCFKGDVTGRLNSSNAKLVDVIHTDSVPTGDHLGMYAAAGHLDLYPDYGSNQPACVSRHSRSWFDGSFVTAIINKVTSQWTGEYSAQLARNLLFSRKDLLCNHYKAPEYFILSIIHSNCKFWAIPEKEKQHLKKKDFNISEFCKKNNVCVEMGLNAGSYTNKKLIGKYYIDITSTFERCNIDKSNYIKVKVI